MASKSVNLHSKQFIMKMAVAQALLQSYSYSDYRNIIKKLLAEGRSTGEEQSEMLLEYSNLNAVRMNRLDKTMVIAEDVILDLLSLTKKYIWLVLSEGWCGDAAQLMPIINKMALVSNNIDLQVVLRDENPNLMNLFLTNGAKSIPKLIIIDAETMNVLGSWGPRPHGAAELIRSYKLQYGEIDETAKTELQLWYLHDKGISTQREIVKLMTDSETFYLKGNK